MLFGKIRRALTKVNACGIGAPSARLHDLFTISVIVLSQGLDIQNASGEAQTTSCVAVRLDGHDDGRRRM